VLLRAARCRLTHADYYFSLATPLMPLIDAMLRAATAPLTRLCHDAVTLR